MQVSKKLKRDSKPREEYHRQARRCGSQSTPRLIILRSPALPQNSNHMRQNRSVANKCRVRGLANSWPREATSPLVSFWFQTRCGRPKVSRGRRGSTNTAIPSMSTSMFAQAFATRVAPQLLRRPRSHNKHNQSSRILSVKDKPTNYQHADIRRAPRRALTGHSPGTAWLAPDEAPTRESNVRANDLCREGHMLHTVA